MKTIAIDFDGTLCTGRYPLIGEPQPGSAGVLKRLYDAGCYIIIWTCRQGAELEAAQKWLDDNGFCYHAINENNPAHVKQYGGDTRKINADVYIDDRQLGGLPPWSEIGKMLMPDTWDAKYFPRILRCVCDAFDVTAEDLLGDCRKNPLPSARQALAFVLVEKGAGFTDIAGYTQFNRGTLRAQIKTARVRMEYDPAFKKMMAELLTQ